MLIAVGIVVVTPLVLTRLGLGAMTEIIVGFARGARPSGMAQHGRLNHQLSRYIANFANYDATYGISTITAGWRTQRPGPFNALYRSSWRIGI